MADVLRQEDPLNVPAGEQLADVVDDPPLPVLLERHGEPRIVESICEMLARGHVERILLSQDVCHDSQLRRYGGNGYTYLADTFLPRLRDAGVSDDEIRTITVENPRRLLTIG